MADVIANLTENQKREIFNQLKTEFEPDQGAGAGLENNREAGQNGDVGQNGSVGQNGGVDQDGQGGEVGQNDQAGQEYACDDRKLPSLVKFSGGKAKGESSYKKWKFEVLELVDANCPGAKLRRAIQKSLFGHAAETFMSIPKEASVHDILDKFDKLFLPSGDSESLLSKFYLSTQTTDESISEWFIRLESLLDVPALNLTSPQKESMLRARFWKGLVKDGIRTSLRHKYDSGESSVQLLNSARQVAEELGATAQHQPVQVSNSDPLVKLTSVIETLTDRITKLESSQQSKLPSHKKFKGKCHRCKKYGHKASDCKVKKDLNEKLSV